MKIFDQSGVLEKAVDDWEEKDIADQTLANLIPHFKKANKLRLSKDKKAAKEILAANTALTKPTEQAKEGQPTGLEGWGYCFTHGICSHSSANCTKPKEGHKKDATMANRMGGSTKAPGKLWKPRNPSREQENTPP